MPSKIAKILKKSAAKKLSRSEKLASKKKLVETKNQIVRKMSQIYSESKEVESGATADLADKAESSYTKEFLLSLTDTEREQLLQIDEALRALDKGTYGVCQACGKTISRKRLEALPWATNCIECQQELEQEKS